MCRTDTGPETGNRDRSLSYRARPVSYTHLDVYKRQADTSILASIATPFAVLLIPLGFGVWQLAAAAITGFIAKENVVGTLAVVYSLTRFIDTDELAMTGGANEVALTMGLTTVSALAYLMFNLYTPPCFAAIGAMNSEMKSAKWLWSAIGLQLATGYAVAFLVYQFGTLFTTGALGEASVSYTHLKSAPHCHYSCQRYYEMHSVSASRHQAVGKFGCFPVCDGKAYTCDEHRSPYIIHHDLSPLHKNIHMGRKYVQRMSAT